jgi:cytochrome c
MTSRKRLWPLAVACVIAFCGNQALAQAEKKSDDTGQIKFNNACRTCHTVKEGDNRLGPNLHKIVGRKAGSVEGFNYSPALKESGLVWDETTLDKFIANPEQALPGNNMKPFTGIASAEERKAIISYLAEQ